MTTNASILKRANELQELIVGSETTPFMKSVNNVIFDTCLQAQSDVRGDIANAPIYAIPASTGSGKSTFTCSLIAAFFESDDKYSAAFVANTIQEAQSIYNSLSKILPEGALSLHTSAHSSNNAKAVELEYGEDVSSHLRRFGQSTTGDLKKHRVVVCTHALWIKEGRDESDLGIRLFNGNFARNNVFVDEQPDLIETLKLCISDISFLYVQAQRTPDKSDAISTIALVSKRLMKACTNEGGRFDAVDLISRVEYEKLGSIEPNELESGSELDRITQILRFLELASQGNCFLARGHISGEKVEGVRRSTFFIAYGLNFNVNSGTIILDATANCSALTTLNSRVSVVEAPNVNYRNLTLNHIEAPTQFKDIASRFCSKSTDEDYVRFIKKLVKERTESEEEILVVVHKRLLSKLPEFERLQDRKVHYCNWGTGIGSNKWRNCTSVFLLSEFHLPRSVYLSATLASQENRACAVNIRSALGQNMVGRTLEVANGHRMRWLKQMASRGNVRNADENGVCGSMKLFTTMDKSLFANSLQELFPHATEPKFILSNQVERKTKPAQLQALLSKHIEGEFCGSKIAEDFGWKVKDVGRAFNSKTCEYLRNIGWELIPGNGKASNPTLKKTPYQFNAGPFECVL